VLRASHIAGLALGFSISLWASPPLPSSFSNRSIRDVCTDLFGYLEFTEPRPGGQYIRSYLEMPGFVDPKAQAQPTREIKVAVTYVAHLAPDPVHASRGISLAQQRAYTLKAFFLAIGEVYPEWTARLYRDHEGNFIFFSNLGRYVKIAARDGSVSWGDEVLSLPD